jgi:hypothetical protein
MEPGILGNGSMLSCGLCDLESESEATLSGARELFEYVWENPGRGLGEVDCDGKREKDAEG